MIDDLDRIMAVMQAAFDPTYGEAWNRGQVSDALIMPNTHYLLAGPGGAPPREDEPAVGFTLSRGAADEEELLLIAVAPPYRGRGLGAALMQRFVDEAHERGVVRLFLEMRDGNTAEALDHKFGFVSVGRRKNYYRRGSGSPTAIRSSSTTPGRSRSISHRRPSTRRRRRA